MRASAPPRRPSTILRRAALLLIAASLVPMTTVTLRAQEGADSSEAPVTTEKVVKKATPRFVETLLDELELNYKPHGKNGYLVRLEGTKMLVLIESGGGIMLYCGFEGVKVDTKKINDWNKKHRFSRAYLDDTGDPVLESDLDFDGGVTLESLKLFIKVFKSSVADYKKFLSP